MRNGIMNDFYKHVLTNSWGCTQQLVDFITDLFIKEPSILEDIKEELKLQKGV